MQTITYASMRMPQTNLPHTRPSLQPLVAPYKPSWGKDIIMAGQNQCSCRAFSCYMHILGQFNSKEYSQMSNDGLL